MENMWMVRCGKNGDYYDDFKDNNVVAIGWKELGNLSNIQTRQELNQHIKKTYSKNSNTKNGQTASMIWNFIHEFTLGDYIITYNPSIRKYLVGKVTSNYNYVEKGLSENVHYVHQRKVKWINTVDRDDLQLDTKNTLGALLTVFSLKKGKKGYN